MIQKTKTFSIYSDTVTVYILSIYHDKVTTVIPLLKFATDITVYLVNLLNFQFKL